MFWLLRILTCWIPVRHYHIEKGSGYMRIRLSELGVRKQLSDTLLGRLTNEAYIRAEKKSFFGWVSYGLFMFEATKIADEVAMYVKYKGIKDANQRIRQIMEISSDG